MLTPARMLATQASTEAMRIRTEAQVLTEAIQTTTHMATEITTHMATEIIIKIPTRTTMQTQSTVVPAYRHGAAMPGRIPRLLPSFLAITIPCQARQTLTTMLARLKLLHTINPIHRRIQMDS